MKNTLITLMALLTSILIFTGSSQAHESVSLMISCKIPAIPGVNAPAEEAKAPAGETTVQTAESSQQPQQEAAPKEETLIVQEETQLAKNGFQTIYSR